MKNIRKEIKFLEDRVLDFVMAQYTDGYEEFRDFRIAEYCERLESYYRFKRRV